MSGQIGRWPIRLVCKVRNHNVDMVPVPHPDPDKDDGNWVALRCTRCGATTGG